MEFFRDILEDSNQSSNQPKRSDNSSLYSAPEGRFNPDSSSSNMNRSSNLTIESPMEIISELQSQVERLERNQPSHLLHPTNTVNQLDTAIKKFMDDPLAVHRMMNPNKTVLAFNGAN